MFGEIQNESSHTIVVVPLILCAVAPVISLSVSVCVTVSIALPRRVGKCHCFAIS
jgi:hypothetical protein